MKYFNKIKQIDRDSRCVLVEGGIYGPELEAQLKEFVFITEMIINFD